MAGPGNYILAIDQGTTNTRAILFSVDGAIAAVAQRELQQIYPDDGWVEHDAEEIWEATLAVCREVLAGVDLAAGAVAAIGITNQRETTVLWDRESGKPLHNAIVWQDRRTAPFCAQLRAGGHGAAIQEKTGLVVDPYFSGTKIKWLLDNVAGARAAAEAGALAVGTIDCFLLWRLSGGTVHASDATNASRTMLFNIHTQAWDDELLALLDVPRAILPEVKDSAGHFANSAAELFGVPLPITGIAGDQQAALVGQACFSPGMGKSTYGTGCFAMLNTGAAPFISKNQLLTTVAYRLDGRTTYALEGSIFIAGAAIQWLRDELKLIRAASDSEALAASLESTGGVYLVPAFTGLGAPYWDAGARGAIVGLTRDSGIPQLTRAALEAVCYQTRDLTRAMTDDGAQSPQALRVDGGMVANDWLMQFLADILDIPVDRPTIIETTALGAAYLAGLGCGVYASLDDIAERWQLDRRFNPAMADARRQTLYGGWLDAVDRVRSSNTKGP